MTAPAVAAPMAAINTAPAATSNELRISSLCSCVIARATFSSEVLKASAESTIAMHIAKMDHSVSHPAKLRQQLPQNPAPDGF
jgi:hypothetical protein